MRSANSWNANNVRIVNSDGSLNNNAVNSNGCSPDCEKCQFQVAERQKQYAHTRSYCPISVKGENDLGDTSTSRGGLVTRTYDPIIIWNTLIRQSNLEIFTKHSNSPAVMYGGKTAWSGMKPTV